MTCLIRRTLLVLLLFSVACSDLRRPGPPGTGLSPSQPPPPQSGPPLTGPARTFLFSGPLTHPVGQATAASQYVLYDNGAFALRYPGFDLSGEYRQEAGGIINFGFCWSNVGGGRTCTPPGSPGGQATGALRDDSLEVRYTESMHHNDFEDAVYRLAP